MEEKREVQKKIILLGDAAVGKTSLIRRFVVDRFDDRYILTIGTKITAKALQIGVNKDIIDLKLQIWDILGQKGYTKLHHSSFKGTDGVILVADITRNETLLSLATYWIPKVRNLVGEVPLIILANKADLMENSEFSPEDLKIFSSKFNAPCFLTSAKNGENVHQAFYNIGKRMIEFKSQEYPSPSKSKIIHPRLIFNSEKSEIVKIIDKIMDDFCREYGNMEEAMPVLRKQFESAGLNLNNPSKTALKRAIHGLAEVEMTLITDEIAEANEIKRLKWIKEMKHKDT